jgi:hypothetical protein
MRFHRSLSTETAARGSVPLLSTRCVNRLRDPGRPAWPMRIRPSRGDGQGGDYEVGGERRAQGARVPMLIVDDDRQMWRTMLLELIDHLGRSVQDVIRNSQRSPPTAGECC